MVRALPLPRFDHLRRMTDDQGLFEHAEGLSPRRHLGYCTDDAARALVLTCLAGGPADLRQRYLDFVVTAVAEDGYCHNRRDLEGNWADAPGLGDWWGRAIWGLGVAVASGVGGAAAEQALDQLTRQRAPFLRSMAYAALGAAQVADQPRARALLADAVAAVVRVESADGQGPDWPWPEPRLSYDNALLPHALLAGGRALERPELLTRGLDWLEFLVCEQSHDGHLSIVPVGGRDPGDQRPAFDQQPIELASLAAAGSLAYQVTGASRWRDLVAAAAAWFDGDNDNGVIMFDDDTGVGYDGLTRTGRSSNAGAESTLAANLVLLLANRLGIIDARHPCSSRRPGDSS